MKKILFLVFCSFGIAESRAQCDSTEISNAMWSLVSVNSEEPADPAVQSFDGNSNTIWHTEWRLVKPDFPHEITLDLDTNYPVAGMGYLPRQTGELNGKVTDYEIYLSLDGINWTLQKEGTFTYSGSEDLAMKQSFFNSIDARYVRFIGLKGFSGQHFLVASEFEVYQDSICMPTGQDNQSIMFDAISIKSNTDEPFDVNATATSGLPVTYSIVSGPATIVDKTITLTGVAGTVVVSAEQIGDTSYYPAAETQSFDVVDLSTFTPTIESKLSSAFPIEMPSLYAYPLYASASISDPLGQLSISQLEFEVGGNVIPATFQNGYYLAWWTPDDYKNYDVLIKATASNGNTDYDTINIDVVDMAQTQNVQTFDRDLINFDGSAESRWFYGSYALPQSIGAYEQIVANFAVTCPSVVGGCDDWDRLAYVEYKTPGGEWMELFRYLTPFGVACSHTIDVTDFASMLHGNIEIRMFIDTWGTGGWDLHLDFDYIQGSPDYLYSSIQEVWHGNYNFGDPANLQPCDTVPITYPANTEAATFRITTSGHGWGANNTNNAAEFYYPTHHFHINGTESYSQHLLTDCDPNPDNCTGQAGTWRFDRAGWCPGTIAQPYTYNFTSDISKAPFDLSYIFQQSYQDECHPNNPQCISGVTCPDCNDGFNPFYRVGGYMISFSNSELSTGFEALPEEKPFSLDVFPNPANGNFRLEMNHDLGPVVATIHNIAGTAVKTFFFGNQAEINGHLFNVSDLAKGTYFVKVNTEHQSNVRQVVVQ